jgi:MerR family redox-sensitive transcriptional activator SoxR
MSTSKGLLSIGEVASRTGLAVSAIRYYDDEGLVSARRTPGGRRMFIRSDIRRLSFILIAQQMGFSLEEIRAQLKQLPLERTPNKRDWEEDQPRFPRPTRCPHRNAGTAARPARRLHRLRLPVA